MAVCGIPLMVPLSNINKTYSGNAGTQPVAIAYHMRNFTMRVVLSLYRTIALLPVLHRGKIRTAIHNCWIWLPVFQVRNNSYFRRVPCTMPAQDQNHASFRRVSFQSLLLAKCTVAARSALQQNRRHHSSIIIAQDFVWILHWPR